MKKLLFGFLTAAVMAGTLAGCSKPAAEDTKASESADASAVESTAETSAESETAEKKAEGGSFIVGFDQNFPPMGFVDNGEYTGFDLELAEEVAKRLGKEFKAQPIEWDSKDMELSAGTIDCIWNGFTMTGREEDYTWSEPYMNNSQVFVVAKASGITDRSGLAGKTVEVQADSSAEAALNEQPELKDTFQEVLTTPDYNTAFMDLEQGAVDAVAMDVIVAGYQLQQRGDEDFMILDDDISSEEYAVGFKKGNTELRDQVQETLNEMAADGTLKQISEKWFGKDMTTIGK